MYLHKEDFIRPQEVLNAGLEVFSKCGISTEAKDLKTVRKIAFILFYNQ